MVLTGEDLKARVAELQPASESDIAIACGYVSEAGKARLSAFKDALLDAHGLALGKAKGNGGRKGKPLSFLVTAGKTGNIVMAGGYGALIGVEPGEQVQISHQGGQLILSKAGVTATATPAAEPAPVVISETAPVVTYDSTPEPALAAA
jgi:hypothetical protein